MVCGLPGALSAIEKEPLTIPIAVGTKVTLKVQWADGASEGGQLLLSEKGAVAGVMLEIIRAVVVLVFVRRTDLAELVVPTT